MPVYRHLSLCIEAERAALPDSAPSSFHLVAPVNDREQVGGGVEEGRKIRMSVFTC